MGSTTNTPPPQKKEEEEKAYAMTTFLSIEDGQLFFLGGGGGTGEKMYKRRTEILYGDPVQVTNSHSASDLIGLRLTKAVIFSFTRLKSLSA